jgi:hypothetical protein
MKICPICEIRSSDTEKCPECGKRMVGAIRLCSRCGETTPLEQKYCKGCGRDLSVQIF